jgi:hypothetical protein
MIEKRLWIVFVLINLTVSSQIKGVVNDSISGKPIPFVSVWSENQNIGTTSEENGEFTINTNEKSKKLVFSALGFEKKTVKIAEAKNVKLAAIEYQLDEVVISKSRHSREIEIGKTANTICQAFDNGPRIDVKFFPYSSNYKRTKYIKQLTLYTDSRIENATVRIHFYDADENGFPNKELLLKDRIVIVRKGTINQLIDVSDLNLIMPKKGLFVGFEKLIIEKNKLEKIVTNSNTNETKIQTTYYPFILYNYVERDFLFTYSGGKWNKQTMNVSNDSKDKEKIYEPAINLILTN